MMIRSFGAVAMGLTGTKVLWLFFFATVLISVLFPIATTYWQLTLLDGISSPAEARRIVEAFTPHQRNVHAWITATLDVAYPLAYGGFFIGSALRVFKRHGHYLALPGLLVIPTDLIEGVVQVLALTGTADWLALKAVVTPAKTVLFACGIAVTAIAWSKWLYRRRMDKS